MVARAAAAAILAAFLSTASALTGVGLTTDAQIESGSQVGVLTMSMTLQASMPADARVVVHLPAQVSTSGNMFRAGTLSVGGSTSVTSFTDCTEGASQELVCVRDGTGSALSSGTVLQWTMEGFDGSPAGTTDEFGVTVRTAGGATIETLNPASGVTTTISAS